MTTFRQRTLTASALAGALALTVSCGSSADDEPDTAQNIEDQEETQNGNGEDEDSPSDDEGSDEAGGAAEPAGSVAMDEVEENDSADSCWTVIDGTVYDVTEWVGQHPGGSAAIEQLCGTDGTEEFQGQHSGDSGPEDQLSEFAVGELDE